MNNSITQADRTALQQMLQVEPVLTGISQAQSTLNLKEKELLHAGPPIVDKQAMAKPILHSAMATVLFEGWADTPEEAQQLVLSDQITLTPAQNYGVAVPLADVLSPNMFILHVQDKQNSNLIAYSSINGGDGPVTRVGMFNQDVVDRLHYIYGPIATTIASLLENSQPELLPIAEKAILKGDDLHGRTANASALLFDALVENYNQESPELLFIQNSAAFFLNVWMAASLCTLLAGAGVKNSSAIIRMGSNGVEFGIQIAALPGVWFTAPAQAPFIPDATTELRARALGAIGDSAVVDALGYGAMLNQYAPETAKRLRSAAEQSQQSLPTGLLSEPHSAYSHLPDFRTGLTARQVIQQKTTPVVSLGVLDSQGEKGRLDGGFFFAPLSPFQAALEALVEV